MPTSPKSPTTRVVVSRLSKLLSAKTHQKSVTNDPPCSRFNDYVFLHSSLAYVSLYGRLKTLNDVLEKEVTENYWVYGLFYFTEI